MVSSKFRNNEILVLNFFRNIGDTNLIDQFELKKNWR